MIVMCSAAWASPFSSVVSCSGQPTGPHAAYRPVHPGLGTGRAVLVVTDQPAAQHQDPVGLLRPPADRLRDGTSADQVALDDFHRDAQAGAVVDHGLLEPLVHQRLRHRRGPADDLVQRRGAEGVVVDGGGQHHHGDHQARHVNSRPSLAARHLLGGVTSGRGRGYSGGGTQALGPQTRGPGGPAVTADPASGQHEHGAPPAGDDVAGLGRREPGSGDRPTGPGRGGRGARRGPPFDETGPACLDPRWAGGRPACSVLAARTSSSGRSPPARPGSGSPSPADPSAARRP